MRSKESVKSFKIGLYGILGILACLGWIGLTIFLYSLQLETYLFIRIFLVFILALLGSAAGFLFLWRPIQENAEMISHEDFGRALRAQKIAEKYILLPGIKRNVRKETVPAAIIGVIIFLLGISPLGPFKNIKIIYPEGTILIARDLLRPTLFLAGDSLALLTPPALSPHTEAWEKVFPEKTPSTKLIRLILQGKYQEAADLGNVTPLSDADNLTFQIAHAQALLLNQEYERALKEFLSILEKKPSAEIKSQIAVTYMYLNDLHSAQEYLNQLSSDTWHNDFFNPEIIHEHLSLLHSVLSGKNIRTCGDKMKRLWNTQWNTYLSCINGEEENSTTKTQKKSSAEKEISLQSAAETLQNAQLQNLTEEQENLARQVGTDFMVFNNNHAVLMVLLGTYAGAYHEAEWSFHLAEEFSSGTGRLSKFISASAWNTQGIILTCFEKIPAKEEDSAKTISDNQKIQKDEKLPTNIQAVMNILADTSSANNCFQQSEKLFRELGEDENSVMYLILQSNLLAYYIQCEFSTYALPTQTLFQEIAKNPLRTVREISQKQNKRMEEGFSPKSAPTWIIAADNALMHYYSKVEGREKILDQCFQTATAISSQKLGEDSLSEIALRTLYIEMRISSRFAKNEILGSLKETENMLTKCLSTAEKKLPPSHPLLARLSICNARMALMNNNYKKAGDAIKKTQNIYTELELPLHYSKKLLLASTSIILKYADSLKSGDSDDPNFESKITSEFQKSVLEYLNILGNHSLSLAQAYRDLAYIYNLCGNPKKAADEYQKALDVYLTIYGEKTPHPFINATKSLISDVSPKKKNNRSR
ncbi:MAG: tetratricopeptide repeat protein [Planctomycetia bacterium]|nr:tetratricopeptide repeat protein [Planctomycetia bacterium]